MTRRDYVAFAHTNAWARARLTCRFFWFYAERREYSCREVIVVVKSSSWSRPLASEFRLLRVATRGTRCTFQSPTRRAASNPRSIQPQTPVHRTSKAGLPSRSTGKRPRYWVRSRDFRFAPSYLVTVMRLICVYDTCYITTAYIPAQGLRASRCAVIRFRCATGRDAYLYLWCAISCAKLRYLRDSAEDWSGITQTAGGLWCAECWFGRKLISRTFENSSILKRYWKNASERAKKREEGRKRETWDVLAAIGDFSKTRIFREIFEKCCSQCIFAIRVHVYANMCSRVRWISCS